MENDTEKLRDTIQQQEEEIARLKQQIANLESRKPSVVERVVENVVQQDGNEVSACFI